MGAVPTSRFEKPRTTYEDLLKVPANKVAEIVDGELYVSPRWLLLATRASDALVRAEPFDAIELDLLPLWGETRPSPR